MRSFVDERNYMNSENYKVLSKVISAVETGGQVYGQGRYNDYTPPYKNTPNEHTITLGWAQNYGYEARKLVRMIFDRDKAAFRRTDTCSPSIESMLSRDWEALGWNPNSGQKNVLIKLISSDIGRTCQDELFAELMKKFVADCEATYTKDVKAVMMYCQIRHLGGIKAADRIFKRCKGNYSMDNIMEALKQDQYDTSSSNQVGDKIFWSRHQKCCEFISKYSIPESGDKKGVIPTATALSRAKTLLRQPQGSVMTGYTPYGKSYFVSAGKFTNTPKKGYVIYFYSTTKGRVGHVGLVEKVDTANKIVYTIEGNTSSTEYAENGGCVARHAYYYTNQGGTNRVNGFGIPNFEGAGVTADQLIATAQSFLGYLEKRSNAYLDDKTANAGSNNFQRFQRDVGAGNGEQWCQYFVDAMALYTCQGTPYQPSVETKLYETPKWTGYVTADSLNVRKWAGTENDLCSFSPIPYQTAVGVCDEVKASNGNKWYYILYNGKHGFVSSNYISKTKPKDKSSDGTKLTESQSKFLAANQKVCDTARLEKWSYGDSHALPPCADKTISCDRMPARALWDLGFTDQRTGGEVCTTLPTWLTAHGWKQVSKDAIKPGAIVAVRYSNHSYIDHVFVVESYNPKTGICNKYDCGSNERIRSKQPFKNVPLMEWSGRLFVAAWNVPDSLDPKPEPTPEPDPKSDTVYNGVDYQPVYNYTYYKKKYKDLRDAFGTDKKAYFDHFCKFGMKEGRQAASAFDVQKYKARYEDLRKQFGDNLPEYYKHYCVYGKKEGRKAN